MKVFSEDGEIDLEWVTLIIEARELGLSPDEIREFLSEGKFLMPQTE